MKLQGRIKRLNESDQQPVSLPLVGKIKIGEKAKKKRGDQFIEYPTSLDYFVATGNYKQHFTDAYGDKPKKITVIFISDDVSQVCNEIYECRDNLGRLVGNGDGERFYLWDQLKGQYSLIEKPADEEEQKLFRKKIDSLGKWRHVLELTFVLPDLKGLFGQWRLTTYGAKSSIPGITSSFDTVLNFAKTVRFMPFDLSVEKVKSNKPGEKRSYPVLTLVSNISADSQAKLGEFLSVQKALPQHGILNDEAILKITQE